MRPIGISIQRQPRPARQVTMPEDKQEQASRVVKFFEPTHPPYITCCLVTEVTHPPNPWCRYERSACHADAQWACTQVPETPGSFEVLEMPGRVTRSPGEPRQKSQYKVQPDHTVERQSSRRLTGGLVGDESSPRSSIKMRSSEDRNTKTESGPPL